MKRRLLRLPLFLLLGAILSIAIANVCGLWCPVKEGATPFVPWLSDFRFATDRMPPEPEFLGDTAVRFGHFRQPIPGNAAEKVDREPQVFDRIDAGIGYVQVVSDLPFGGDEKRAAGWPWRCVMTDPMLGRGTGTIIERGIAVPQSWKALRTQSDRYIMLNPVWSGLILDSALFGLAFALIFECRAGVRLIRTLCGLCPACAYPIGESSVCTECGKAVKP